MVREYFIKNMKGVLYCQDLALFRFDIQGRELVSFQDLSNQKWWPPELKVFGVSYGSINDFFRRRVVEDNAMFLHEYLDAMGLKYYNFEEMVKRNNGNNHLDDYWVCFEGIGAQCFDDILTQDYPIYKSGTI